MELGLKVEVGVGEGFPLPWVIIFFLLFFPFSQLTLKQKITCSAMDYGQELAKKMLAEHKDGDFYGENSLG